MTGQDEQHLVQPPKFRIPWPTRLAKSAFELSLFCILIGILTVALNVGFLFVVALGIMIASAVFALVSFGGLLFYRFKVPGLGKCIWTMIILYPVFAIGLAIVQPALSRAKVVAGTILCKSNIRQLHLAFVSYQRENGVWPTKSSWSDLIKETLSSPDAFQCPTGKLGPCSYAMNAAIPDDASDLPADLVLLFESAPGWNRTGGPADVVTDRHGKHRPGANIAFADGRVEFIPAEEIPALRWTVEKGTKRAVEKNSAGVQRE